jgi:ferredoxin
MAIPNTRTRSAAEIRIDRDRCTGCGLCVEVCKDFGLRIRDGMAETTGEPFFGCIGCGHCMAVCPSGAIEIHGRTLSPADLFNLPGPEGTASYEALLSLLQRRWSFREFRDESMAPDLASSCRASSRPRVAKTRWRLCPSSHRFSTICR